MDVLGLKIPSLISEIFFNVSRSYPREQRARVVGREAYNGGSRKMGLAGNLPIDGFSENRFGRMSRG